MRMRTAIRMSIAYLVVALPAHAAIWSVPGDAPTIGAAIGAASAGDTILVDPGTYDESIVIPIDLTLLSVGGASVTTIDGVGGEVVRIPSGVTFHIEGFTITGGASPAPPGGGAVQAFDADGVLRSCRFVANEARGDGGAVTITGANSFEVDDCRFENNEAWIPEDRDGGGLWIFASDGYVRGCEFFENEAHEGGALAIVGGSDVFVEESLFVRNYASSPGVAGGAVVVTNSTSHMRRNTFVDNVTETSQGAAVALFSNFIVFEQNIVTGSTHIGLLCDAAFVDCNDLWGNAVDRSGCSPGPNDFSVDPQFCDAAADDYSISSLSLCSETFSPCGAPVGAFDPACGPVSTPAAVPVVQKELRLLPNPTTGAMVVRLPSATREARAVIYDPAGRRVAEIGMTDGVGVWDGSIDGREAPSGIYFVRVQSGETARLAVLR